MTAPVSVVIPTLEAADRIGPCLGALGEAVMEGVIHEVVVADGGSGDGIGEIAETVGARLITAPAGRGAQLAAGAQAARGQWLLFLHADTVLAPGWGAAVLAHVQGRPGHAGWFDLGFDAPGAGARLVAGWANLRSRLFGLPYGDQGLLISRRLYDEVGGYAPMPLMEDVDFVSRIGQSRLARLGVRAETSAARYRADGWLRRGWRNLSTLALYYLGADPEHLARRYRSL
ncbi:MAG: TIGR04283 family arsenosugar biosynthesis glycosyltransferase [Paracoccaceae bacterium]|nr:TIGR04283 family arsenosugar biosynthesis glycosyltransferase [Paracoccaceae bacterium]